MVGALMYLTASRPDIVHATCYCAHYQAKPTEKHLTAVKQIFWYLKGSVNMGLWYPKDTSFELTAFSDSDHAGCLNSRKSTSGGIQFLGGDKLVSWSSKKQDCTSMSLAEAEYVSLSACCAQFLWLRTQLTDYGFHFDKIPMYCDSKTAIAISCNPVPHSRTKHIDVRYHFIKEQIGLSILSTDVSKADSSESEYESWGDSDDDVDQQSDDEQTMFDNQRTSDDEEETQEDKFVHTPENYVPTDDETNMKSMIVSMRRYAEHENVNQEVAGDQVKDVDQATVTTAPTTQKTKVPLPSSSISSDYATKFLNFDNIPSADTKIISMMEIKVQHEDPSSQTSPLLAVPVLVISESLTTPATTIPPPILPFIPFPQQSTLIPTPTTTEATISTTTAPDSETLSAIH
ncbi:hypothetical protein Tco_1407259 [Tanacetum coccineum]